MRMRSKLTIGAVAAGLALTACGSGSGPASATHRDHARALSQQQVQQAGLSLSDVEDLAKLKREHADAVLRAERAQSR
jgi:hypothetical protein